MTVPPAPSGPEDTPSGPNLIINAPQNTGPGCFVRLIYFVFVGWWLSALCITISYLLMVTVIGIPISVTILNRLPQITALDPRSQRTQVTTTGNTTVINFQVGATQRNWIVRAVYFIFVGWWLTFGYLMLAWIVTVFTLGWAALFLYKPVPALLTLHRN